MLAMPTRLRQPQSFRRFGGWLRPTGRLLVLTVPNVDLVQRHLFGKRWYSWLAPRHWQMFTLSNLKQMAADLGYEVVDEKHFFVRTASATVVTSLFPNLDPLTNEGAPTLLAYGGLFYALLPVEWVASLFKRSGFMGIVVRKRAA
jgi:hypothetical protein